MKPKIQPDLTKKIYNPATKRYVNIDGVIGRRLVLEAAAAAAAPTAQSPAARPHMFKKFPLGDENRFTLITFQDHFRPIKVDGVKVIFADLDHTLITPKGKYVFPMLCRPMAWAMRFRRFSFLTDSAEALKLITAGKNMAFKVPWCRRGLTPPRLWLSECTQPKPFWNAMAPCMLALIMFQRASRSAPLAVARAICAQPRARPSRPMPSAGGLMAGAIKVSMQCAIASMPVAAVNWAGRPRVSSGSQIAALGTKYPL